MDQQKQWLFSYYDLGNIKDALWREQSRMEDPALMHLVSHRRQINELIEKVAAIMGAAGRIYKEDDKDDEGTISERLLVSLIPADVNERWEDPYTVIPVGAKWAVVYKDTVSRPVGEKLYTQDTHAYRACRRLNAAYWENEAIREAEVTATINTLLEKLPEGYPPAQFSKGTTGYMLMIEHTIIFQGATAEEAIRHTTNYIEAREGHPNLPVGVIYGIYD